MLDVFISSGQRHEVDPPVFGRVELSGWRFGVAAGRGEKLVQDDPVLLGIINK